MPRDHLVTALAKELLGPRNGPYEKIEALNGGSPYPSIDHVMQFLGHRNIKNTLIYTQLIKLEREDAFHSATAKTTAEAKDLVESGFEYVCTTPENLMLFRKRK